MQKKEEYMYCIHRIKKKPSGIRLIEEPSPIYRIKQKEILILLKGIQLPTCIHGVKHTSTSSNSQVHTAKAVVFKIDIKDFFHSIKVDRVNKVLKQFISIDSNQLNTYCFLEDRLPTGAITSPILANI